MQHEIAMYLNFSSFNNCTTPLHPYISGLIYRKAQKFKNNMWARILELPVCAFATVALDYGIAEPTSSVSLGANFEFSRELKKNIFLRRSHDETKDRTVSQFWYNR